MKLSGKKLWTTAIWTCLVLALLISMSFVSHEQDHQLCKQVSINIGPEIEEGFVDQEEVVDVITGKKGLAVLVDLPLGKDSIPAWENRLRENKFIKSANVYTTVAGELKVNIIQRKPLIRIIQDGGKGYYIDEYGHKMPLSPKYTARVIVASGNIYEKFGTGDTANSYVAKELYTLATYVDKKPFWKAQIEQIFVNQSNELILIPKVGNHRIIFGNTDDMDDKFRRLLAFYKKGLGLTGWNKYSSINLKFKHQVVCEKANH